MITFLGQETLSTHISWPRNVIMSHFLAKKCYQPVGSVITFLRREIVTPITDIMLHTQLARAKCGVGATRLAWTCARYYPTSEPAWGLMLQSPWEHPDTMSEMQRTLDAYPLAALLDPFKRPRAEKSEGSRRQRSMAKFLHCVRTACALRGHCVHTGHAEAGILTQEYLSPDWLHSEATKPTCLQLGTPLSL